MGLFMGFSIISLVEIMFWMQKAATRLFVAK